MKVLIVTDDADMRRKLAEVLRWEGFSVSTAPDVEEGLARATPDDPDFILFDSHIGGEHGLDFVDRYLGAGGSALLVLMAPYSDRELAVEAMKRGVYDYLPRPFTPDEALMTLRKAAEREKRRSRDMFGDFDTDVPKPES